VVPESQVVRCVHCEEDVVWQAHISLPDSSEPQQLWRGCCLTSTHLATRLSRTTTATARTENHRQLHTVLLCWWWA